MFKMDKVPGQLKVAFWPDPRKEDGERYNTVRWRLMQDPCIALEEVTAEEIRASILSQKRFDALFVAGGNASNYKDSLGRRGVSVIHDFVGEGGGYIGECAGAFLATQDYMGLLHTVSVADMEGWRRGKSNDCVIQMTERGRAILDLTTTTTTTTTTTSPPPTVASLLAPTESMWSQYALPKSPSHDEFMITRYCNGPLLKIGREKTLPRNPEGAFAVFEFASDFCGSDNSCRRNVMPQCAAVVAAKYRAGHHPGRVVLISPHPADSEPAMRTCYTNLVRWACRVSPAPILPPSRKKAATAPPRQRSRTHSHTHTHTHTYSHTDAKPTCGPARRASKGRGSPSRFAMRNESNKRRLEGYTKGAREGDKRVRKGGDKLPKKLDRGGDKLPKQVDRGGDKRVKRGGDKQAASPLSVVEKMAGGLTQGERHAIARLAWLQNRETVFDTEECASDARNALKNIKRCPDHTQVVSVLQSAQCLDVSRMRGWLTAMPRRQTKGVSGARETAIICLFNAMDRQMKKEKTVSLSGHIRVLATAKRHRATAYPSPSSQPIIYGSTPSPKAARADDTPKNFLPLLDNI